MMSRFNLMLENFVDHSFHIPIVSYLMFESCRSEVDKRNVCLLAVIRLNAR